MDVAVGRRRLASTADLLGTGTIAPANLELVVVDFDASSGIQHGSTIHLGQGNDGARRRVADVRVHAYRGGTDQACGFNVVATTWSSQ